MSKKAFSFAVTFFHSLSRGKITLVSESVTNSLVYCLHLYLVKVSLGFVVNFNFVSGDTEQGKDEKSVPVSTEVNEETKAKSSKKSTVAKVIGDPSLLLENNTITEESSTMIHDTVKLNLSPFFVGLPGSLPSDRWRSGSFS